MITQICKTCKKDKPLDSFKDNRMIMPHRKHWRCISCQEVKKEERRVKQNNRSVERNKNNKESLKIYHQKRYKEKNNEIREKQKEYDAKNKDKSHERYLKRSEGKVKFRLGQHGPFNTRICACCKENKHITEFYKSKYASFGFGHVCKPCQKIRRKIYHKKHKERVRLYCKNYRENSPENFKKSQIKHRQSEKSKARRSKPHNRIIKSTSSYIRAILKRVGLKKQTGAMQYVGCSKEFFIKHIESQFIDGMTLENFGVGQGKWVIDHYIPCEIFNLEDTEDHKVCFHWTNLRPEWWIDNGIKQDTMPDGRRARNTKHEYTLSQKQDLIFNRLKSLNLPHIQEFLNNLNFPIHT